VEQVEDMDQDVLSEDEEDVPPTAGAKNGKDDSGTAVVAGAAVAAEVQVKKKSNFTKYTLEEDAAILRGHEIHKGNWAKILATEGLNRSVTGIKKRFIAINSANATPQKVPSDAENSREGLPEADRPRSPVKRSFSSVAGPADEADQPASQKRQRASGTLTPSIPASTAGTPTVPAPPAPPPASQTPQRKKTTQLTLHDPADVDERVFQLEKKCTETENRLKAEMDRCKQLEKEVVAKDEKISQNQRALDTEMSDIAKKSLHALSALLRVKAAEERKKAREISNNNCLRLASIKYAPKGTSYSETLEEGYAFKDLKEKQAKVAKRKEELEGLRRGLTRRRTAAGVAPAANGRDDEDAIYQQDEYLKGKQMLLKDEEKDLNSEHEALQRERDLHVRELRRIYHEDASPFNDDDKRLLINRYLLISLLGRGGFSEVHKAYDLLQNIEVAVKIHQVNGQWSKEKKDNYAKHAMRELRICKELDHPRMVSLLEVFDINATTFCTVLDYCKGGDLEEYLKENKILPEKEARVIIMQIFSGLKYLNTRSPPIIHYDLKPGNILFDDTGARITDFGLAKIYEDESAGQGGEMELTSQGAGTYWYLPPECFVFDGKTAPTISSKVDVWSAGVIFYQMLFGKRPFGDSESQLHILKNQTILNEARQLDFPARPVVSQEAKDFIRRCLMYNKDVRPEMLTICEDPYLKKPRQPAAAAGDK